MSNDDKIALFAARLKMENMNRSSETCLIVARRILEGCKQIADA